VGYVEVEEVTVEEDVKCAKSTARAKTIQNFQPGGGGWLNSRKQIQAATRRLTARPDRANGLRIML